MNRRDALRAVGLGAGVAVSGCLGDVQSRLLGSGGDPSVTVETIDAPGSSAGERTVPVQGTPTLIDLFATWCIPCEAQMKSLSAVHGEFGDRVAFVSVTNETFGGDFSAADLRRWWREHGGDWTLGHDPRSDLMRTLEAGGLPFLALTDGSGSIAWTHKGVASESLLRERLADAVE
jgi:thiol-disulfide isomerase/thioredoxin